MSLRPEQTEIPRNSSLIKYPRLSRMYNTKEDLWKSRAVEDLPTCKYGLLVLDGGNYGDSKVLILQMRKERLLRSKVPLMPKTEMLLSVTETEK